MTSSDDPRSQLDHLLYSEPPETESYYLDEILKAADAALPGFLTLDADFQRSISNLTSELIGYLADVSLRRPYNVLMIAPPGSGKSHFVKCLGKALKSYRGGTGVEVPIVTGNLSSPDPINALHTAVNEARNHKTVDITPVLFLDEVDSHIDQLAFLLPLLWDGEILLSGQRLTLGRCIIICSISDSRLISYIRDTSKGTEGNFPKVVDFISRINGGDFEIDSINSDSRRHDKVCIAAELIRRKFPDKRVAGIQRSFLRFISSIQFRHEIRSLETFINFIPRMLYPDIHRGKDNLNLILYNYNGPAGWDSLNECLLQNTSRQRTFWKNHTHVNDPSGEWSKAKATGSEMIYFFNQFDKK